ncbi:hypothetical protein Tco_1157720 [Tanacetum coccineum]
MPILVFVRLIIHKVLRKSRKKKNIAEKAANHRTHTLEFLDRFKLTYKESTIPLNNTPHSPDFSALPPQPQYETYSCELCGNNAHYGYDCPTQVPFISNSDPCYNQNFDNNFSQTSQSLPQYLCCTSCGGPHETFQCDQLIFNEPYCENCGGPHMSFQCQPMKQNFYNFNSSGYDQFQPPQYPVSSQPPEESIKEFSVKHAQEMITPVQSAVAIQQHEQAVQKEQEEQAAFTPYWKCPVFDEDDDEYTFQYKEYLENSSNAITPYLSAKEPDNSLNISTVSYPKIDSLFEEFSGELAHVDLIPPGINEAYFDSEEDIRIENDDYDSKGDDLFLEELLNNDSVSLPEYESFHFDSYNVPSSPRPPEKPPDDDGYLDIKPDTGVLTKKVTFDPGISIEVQSKRFLSLNEFSISFISDPLSPVLETLLPFSSENEDKVFNPGILVSKEEKSPHLLSHRGFKAFKNIHNFLNESPMMIYGGDIPIWDVPYLHFDPP